MLKPIKYYNSTQQPMSTTVAIVSPAAIVIPSAPKKIAKVSKVSNVVSKENLESLVRDLERDFAAPTEAVPVVENPPATDASSDTETEKKEKKPRRVLTKSEMARVQKGFDRVMELLRNEMVETLAGHFGFNASEAFEVLAAKDAELNATKKRAAPKPKVPASEVTEHDDEAAKAAKAAELEAAKAAKAAEREAAKAAKKAELEAAKEAKKAEREAAKAAKAAELEAAKAAKAAEREAAKAAKKAELEAAKAAKAAEREAAKAAKKAQVKAEKESKKITVVDPVPEPEDVETEDEDNTDTEDEIDIIDDEELDQ
jgi:hypothetical protein